MALQAAGSPLVACSIKENGMQIGQALKGPGEQEVRVERAFYFRGKPTKVGDTIELPSIFAREMIAAHKAKAVEAKAVEAKAVEAKAVEAKSDNRPVSDERAAAGEKRGGTNAR